MTEDDNVLVKRARNGDIRAFEELVERHRAVVFRVAARVVGPDEADDVSQDALLRAYHRLDSYRGEGSFRAWLLRIVHNTALNQLERRVPEPVGSERRGRSRRHLRGGRARAGEQARGARAGRASRAQAARSCAPSTARCSCCATSRAWPTRRSPTITDSPLGSVKGRLHRARNELIEILRNNTYDWELPE